GVRLTDASGGVYQMVRMNSDDVFLLGNTNFPTYLYGSGGIYAKNTLYVGNTIRVPEIQKGTVSITPSNANTPTSAAVTFDTAFSGTPRVMVTVNNNTVGSYITGVGATGASSTGVTIWLTRNAATTSAINVWWVAVY
ncbi:MAG: hypothetical protein LIO51_05735, partial [Clostridiales bacterium]|nr:hypothetical protein [Clostridiales bacterium]